MNIFQIEKQKRKFRISILGITIYEKILDKKENFVKEKYLLGIFSKKYEFYTKTFKLKFLNFTFFRTKLKGSYKISYLFFFPFWIENINKTFLNDFLNIILDKYPNYDDYYVFLSRSGEFFLLMHHFKQWLTNNKSDNFILIFTARYHLNICKMFFPNVPTAYIKKVNVPLISRGVKSIHLTYKNKNIYVPTNEKYFVNVENSIRDNNKHYYELLKNHLGLNNNIENYNITQTTKDKISNIAKYILGNNFIFISPETLSNEPMEKDFWDTLTTKLKELGYEVFCNAMDFKNLTDNSTSTFLTYEEAIELSKYAKAIIGMRSGFLECLSQNNIPLIALYTDFPKRAGFKRLASNKVLSGFSLSKLPNVNNKLLYEIDVNKYDTETQIIDIIIEKIKMEVVQV